MSLFPADFEKIDLEEQPNQENIFNYLKIDPKDTNITSKTYLYQYDSYLYNL